MDGKLTSTYLSDEGARFTDHYYDEAPQGGLSRYLTDYGAVFGSPADSYSVPNTWDSFDRIAPLIERAYEQWKSGDSGQVIE